MGDEFLEDLTISPPDEYIDYVMGASWMPEAKCRGVNPDLFFPERGESTRESKAICAECPVRRECLEYAVQNVEKFGIWGGKSERERRKIRRDRKRRNAREASEKLVVSGSL